MAAGRVPTSSAYKLYIDSLMQPSELNDAQKLHIDRFFTSNGIAFEAMPQAAADLVNELTGFPSFALFSADQNLSFKQIRLINTGRHSAALLAVTSDGRSLSSMCRFLKICFRCKPYKRYDVLCKRTQKYSGNVSGSKLQF